jgi:site-specific recombinase XerD
MIAATRNLRYRVFLLATYSMGLRLGEVLSLQVGDIDGQRKQVHIRRGKGHKDRFVPLPDLTYPAWFSYSYFLYRTNDLIEPNRDREGPRDLPHHQTYESRTMAVRLIKPV